MPSTVPPMLTRLEDGELSWRVITSLSSRAVSSSRRLMDTGCVLSPPGRNVTVLGTLDSIADGWMNGEGSIEMREEKKS